MILKIMNKEKQANWLSKERIPIEIPLWAIRAYTNICAFIVNIFASFCAVLSHSVVSNSLWPHEL